MINLKHDWLTEGLIDYEYKKYILLAYLQDIKKRFDSSELFPFLSDLIFHFRNLNRVKENHELLYENFPKSISKADFKKLEFTYKKIVKEDDIMKQLEEIIAFALPQLEGAINEGKELFDFVESNLEMDTVGVTPLYSNEGYVLINQDAGREVSVFRYQMSVIERADEKFKAINTTFVANDFRDISRNFEQIKMDLVKRFTALPNPATFSVVSKLKFPLPETVLPVAKRILVRKLSGVS